MINNKNGFAITALLYGLSIMALMVVALMMSVMQNSRKNSSSLVRSIEEELNAYGETAQQYTSGSHDYYVPEGQSGYFKIEFQKGTTLLTGTIYLTAGTSLKIDLDSDPASIKLDDGSLRQIMKANSTGTDVFVAGMARFGDPGSSVPKKYQFLNGQVITGTSTGTRFKASKVADTVPVTNTVYNNVASITLAAGVNAQTITAVTIPDKIANPNNEYQVITKQNTNSLTINTTNKNISAIYIKYGSNVQKPQVTIKNTSNVSTNISPIGLASGYSFASKEFTLSRFGPTNTTNYNLPKDGNYYISKLDKNGSSKTYTLNQQNTLSTTFYTPTSPADATNKANTGDVLIHYGTESYGRPVANVKYQGMNSQKWRFEAIADAPGKYKILEIEEYKPFEVHKQDATYYAVEPHGPGPILICGAYTFLDTNNDNVGDTWTSTDTFTGNINQMWTLEQAGFGTYYLKTNHTQGGGRYLYYDSTRKKYYVTPEKTEASLFQLTNADL